jgi:energy-coupling factor transporter ATPase
VLHFDNVGFAYPSSAGPVRALNGVSLMIEAGETVAVLGANGSGKSTLARLANGLSLPDEGQVTVDGMRTDDPDLMYEVRSSVGLVFQHPDDQIVATSVEDDVAFGPENLGLPRPEIRRRVDAAVDAVGLRGLESREPHQLSGGQKQRLAIAGALAMQPRYLVLDEPTSMLDPRGREEVLAVIAALRAAGHGVLLITHDLAETALANRAVVLQAGEVVFEGSPEELLGSSTLADWALELPAGAALAAALRGRGIPVPPGVQDAATIVDSLCR